MYLGNLRLPVGQDTTCVGCGETVIARDVYNVTAYRLDERGACKACGCQLQGRFGAAGCGLYSATTTGTPVSIT